MPTFTVTFKGKVVQTFSVPKRHISIGRHAGADIIINNPLASRHHATVALREGVWVLEDAGSVNGIYVKGQRIMVHLLTHGDEFQIGKHFIRFEKDRADEDDIWGDREKPFKIDPSKYLGLDPEEPQKPQIRVNLDDDTITRFIDPAKLKEMRESGETTGGPALIIEAADTPARRFMLVKEKTIIGNNPLCDLWLRGDQIEVKHAIVVRYGTHYVVGSLSKKLLKVNGQFVKQKFLNGGDVIEIPPYRIIFV